MAGKEEICTTTDLSIDSAVKMLSEKSELFEKRDFGDDYLPRNVDILAYYHFIRDTRPHRNKQHNVIKAVVEKVRNIWEKTQISIITERHIRARILIALKTYKKIKRNIRGNKCQTNELLFLNNIFDITNCRCTNFRPCACSFKEKLSEDNYIFLVDQATKRQFKIDDYFCDAIVNQSLSSQVSNL